MRVLILSAPVGAGHDAAARGVAAELRARGDEVEIDDGLALIGRGVHKLVVDGYHCQIEYAPWSWRVLYRATRSRRLIKLLGAGLAVRGGGPLARPDRVGRLRPRRVRLPHRLDGARAAAPHRPAAGAVLRADHRFRPASRLGAPRARRQPRRRPGLRHRHAGRAPAGADAARGARAAFADAAPAWDRGRRAGRADRRRRLGRRKPAGRGAGGGVGPGPAAGRRHRAQRRSRSGGSRPTSSSAARSCSGSPT